MNWREFFLMMMLALSCLIAAFALHNIQNRIDRIETRLHVVDGL